MQRKARISIPILKGSIGLFISPQGEIVEVEQSHINTVILYPARFGITTQEIESVYAKHKEPVGVEGSAREEILCNLSCRAGFGCGGISSRRSSGRSP